MKVLHVVPTYIPAYRHGGPVKAVHDLCRMLVKKRPDITVFTTNVDGENSLSIPFDKPQFIEGVRIFYYPVKFPRSYYYSEDLSHTVKIEIRKFDIVHIHSIYLYPTLIAGYWCRRYKIPYIIDPLGALDRDMIRLKGAFKKTLYLNLVEKRNINGTETISATAIYEKEKIESFGFKTPVFVIPRGLDLNDYPENIRKKDLVTEYPQLKDKKIVIFLGRIHPKKGLDLLSVAFRRVIAEKKDVHLVIAGPSEEGYADKVKKLCRKIGIMEQVLFIGMLLEDEKLAAFYSSDIFILPSYGENFGIAVLEAMASGLPVLISDQVGISDDVIRENAGIVFPLRRDAIKEAVNKIIGNKDLGNKLGGNGELLAKKQYDWKEITKKQIDIYKNIIKINKKNR